jgi:site-specific DNA-methyltransferase (adenine-specific)
MSPTVSKRSTNGSPNGIYGKFDVDAPLTETYDDSGGASRFFYNVQTNFDEADPFVYEKKVSQKERNAGLDDLPSQMMGMSGGAQSHGEGYDRGQGIGLNRVTEKKNTHPTLKSISLTKYLATLLLPPIEYAPRRLLVPFSGVSSEMIGALLAGWEYVEGIEMGKEYCEIGEKRLTHWVKK